MTCPLCGDDCRCSEPRAFVSAAVFVDPDAPDDSEEHFAASLAASATPPPRYHRIIMPEPEAPEPQFASAAQGQFALAPQPESSTVADSDFWREEVANRLQNYRAKRRRRAGSANSMELDFDRRPQDAAASVAPPPACDSARPTSALAEEVFSAPVDPPAAYQVSPEPQTMVRWDGTVAEPASPAPEFVPEAVEAPRLPDVWNLIEFPAPEFPRADELAEPVIQTPRILDAPEMVEQAIPTAMADISLENEDDARLLEDIEIPLQVAPLPQRVFGGLVDLFIVLAATATFAVIVLKLCGAIPLSKAALAVGLLVPCFFWIAFQYLFLVYAGATPGMKFAGVALTGFEADRIGRQSRRARALAMALSSVSLGLGFIWALVDEDTLCWHDRITRTYPIQVTGNG